MWEFTIVGNNKLNIYLKNIEYGLKQQSFKVVCSLNKNSLSIACDNKNKPKLENVIKKLLSETIVLFFKEDYYNKHLNLQCLGQQLRNALIKCLCLLDFNEECSDVSLKLNFISLINLESFFLFKLKHLKLKWHEIISVFENDFVFIESEVFLDVLKFLIESIAPKCGVVDVYYSAEKFVITDEDNNVLVFNNSANVEINLITGLITLSPQNINLHCAGALSNTAFKMIYYIFNKKVNLLV